MIGQVALGALSAIVSLDAVFAARGIIGLAVVRDRRGWPVRLALGVALAAYLGWIAASTPGLGGVAAVLAAAGAGPLAIAALLAISALRRLDPDAPYVMPDRQGSNRRVVALSGDGQPICVRPVGAARGVLVLAHGTGNDRIFAFWPLIDLAVARGWCVVTANLPGHGRGDTDVFSAEAARDRLAAMVTAARALDVGPVVLVGQSLGAALALDAVARRAVAVDACVSVSAPVHVSVGARVALELGVVLRPGAYQALRYGTLAEVLPAMGSFRRAAFPIRTGSSVSYVALVRDVVVGLWLPARLAAARGGLPPTLLVNGTLDGVVSVADASVYADAIGAARWGGAGAPPAVAAWWASRVHHADPLLDPTVNAGIFQWIDAVVGASPSAASAAR
jgi:pimeloyl-ACP methyl ester carboxylesterase